MIDQITNFNNMTLWIIVGFIILIIIYIWLKSNSNIVPIRFNVTEDFVNNKKYKNHTILDFLRLVSKKYPKKCALKVKINKHKWKSVSYLEYYKNVLNFSQSVNYWLGPKVNVAISGFNSTGWFYSHMGCMLNGGISVGLYPTSTIKICQRIIQNSNIELLVVDGDAQLEKFIGVNIHPVKLIIYYSPIKNGLVEKFNVPVISMGNFMTKVNKVINRPTLKNTATVIYTSGVIEQLKGTVITHKNIMSSLTQILKLIKSKSSIKQLDDEQFISYLPLNHITGQLFDIYIPLLVSGTVWFADKNALKSSLNDTIYHVKPTIFVGVPRVWEKIAETVETEVNRQGIRGSLLKVLSPRKIIEKMGFDRCKLAIISVAPVSEKTRQYLESIGLPLYDIYGMSETTGLISMSLPSLSRYNSVGAPIMSVKIAPDGEILVKGDNLFSGYFNNKKETDLSFTKDKWFKTGDIGSLDKDGFLYLVGRRNDLIITSGGKNIHPVQIEIKLREYLGKYFDHIIVVGDKLKFLSVVLNGNNLPNDIDSIIQNAIDDTNKMAPSNSHMIKKWLILKNKFKVGDELTPTFEVKRHIIYKKYKRYIDKLYK